MVREVNSRMHGVEIHFLIAETRQSQAVQLLQTTMLSGKYHDHLELPIQVLKLNSVDLNLIDD